MIESFVHTALPGRVVFGHGTLDRLATEVASLRCRRALVVSTPGRKRLAETIAARLGDLGAGVFAGATMHSPVEVTDAAMRVVSELEADCTVAIGGGSAVGLGKAIALRTDLPQIAVPTTYAGSEMTPVLGETKDGLKTAQRSPKLLPETVIYDVDLTLSLPPSTSGTSGINAIAHAIEALYAEDRNPLVSLIAEEGIAVMARSLPRIAADPQNRAVRADALYGAWLCGTCLAAVGMAIHHKLCHTLGGAFDLPHAETHTIILPHAVAYNAAAAPEAIARAARALGTPNVALALYELAGRLGARRALRDIGMPEAGIERAAALAIRNPYWNPRPIEQEAIRELLARAWAGAPPGASGPR